MLRVYSRGGSEFIIPIHFQIQDVYPIEDGIIVKAIYNKDQIYYDPFQSQTEYDESLLPHKNYSYFTITKHPLDDIHPLSFQGQYNMIKSELDLLYCSYKIPLCVFYSHQDKSVYLCLLKEKTNNTTFESNEEEENYIKSIEPQSRNPDLYNVSKDFKLYLQQFYQIQTLNQPDKVFLQKGLTNPYEVIIGFYFKSLCKVAFYICDIRQINNVRNIKLIDNVQTCVMLNFNKNDNKFQNSIDIISKQLYEKQARQNMISQSFEVSFLKRRIKLLQKNLVTLDTNGKHLTFYQGFVPLLQIDLVSQLQPIFSAQSIQITKGLQIEQLSHPQKSNLTVQFSNGLIKRCSFSFQITDFLVRSILKAFKTCLPENLYQTILQDVHDHFAKYNNDEHTKISDQFSYFSSILLSILANEPQYLYSTISVQNQQQTNDQQKNQQQQQQVQVQQIQQQIQQQTKPVSSLQTKILRSSTTNFTIDQNPKKKQTTTYQQQQIQQQKSNTQQQQSQIQNNLRGTRGSLTGTHLQQNQFKRVSTGSSEIQPLTTSLSRSGQSKQIVGNPFQELLNSEFHLQNFNQQYKDLFPQNMQFNITQPEQQPLPTTMLNQSPTKSVKNQQQSLNTTPGGGQRISSTRQSTLLGQERRSSQNITSQLQQQTFTSNIQQMQQQQLQQQLVFKTQRNELLPHINNIFLILHLLHEDLKLNNLRERVECPKLARLIFKLILLIDPQKKMAFTDYYLKEHSFLANEYEQDIKKCYKGNTMLLNQDQIIEIEPVPQLYKWLQQYFQNQQQNQQSIQVYQFPLFFERTRKIARIYEILNQAKRNSYFSPLLTSSRQQQQQFLKPQELQMQQQQNNSLLNGVLMNSQLRQQGEKYQQENYFYSQDYLMTIQMSGLHLFEKILFCLKEENLSLEEIKKFPSIISLPIIEIIRFARLFQQEIQSIPKWPDSLYKLIQREDILNNLKLFSSLEVSAKNINPQYPQLSLAKQQSKKFALNRGMTNVFQGQTIEELKLEQHRKEMENNILQTAGDLIEGRVANFENTSKQQQQEKEDGTYEFLKNRFNQDTRYKEVCNMLSSSQDITIKLEKISNHESLPEDKLHQEKQALLDKLFLRQLAKCVGRGALQFGTQQTLPTEMLHVPKISQTGYVPQTDSYMSVEFKDDQSKDLLQWAEFHNGVASALRIASCLRNKNEGSKGMGKTNSSSQQQTYTTRNWIMYHKPTEPKYEHGGFLLAIGLLGQLDSLQPTDIYQHLKTTHDATAIGILLGRAASKIGTMDDHDTRTLCIHIPYLLPPSLSIDISLAIQSAAVIGAGLLYKGTSNRLMTEMLLAQIGRKPLSDKSIEREGYALASGIALGLVNLGIGSQMQGISDLKLNERLIRFVEGGKTIDLPQSMLSVNFNHDNQKCSAIKEGDMVNVHITSPGAVIALALIHLKTNNEQIANKLSMPQTFYSLEFVRPQFLMLKVLCKNLILWDQIQMKKEWIFQQIPQIIKDIYENDISTVEKMYQQRISEDEIDYSTIALCYINIIAGAILSLGFKYAGTGNKEVFNLISEFVQFFRKLKVVQTNKDSIGIVHSNFTKNQVDKNTLETCLCVAALSMSIVMAGTGDTECFRVLRILRKRFEHDMHYGYNMAINMSLGFLFLGSGAYTLSRNNLAIAALLCSLYPIFPNSPSDNRYHLQALRHFYILAIESRLLQARDIDTGKFVNINVNVEIEEKDNVLGRKIIKNVQMQTPAIINGNILKIEVSNDQYHYICLKMRNSSISNNDELMEIDNDITSSNRLVAQGQDDNQFNLDKRKRNYQNNLQQIIYVKKLTTYTNQEKNQNQSTIDKNNLNYNQLSISNIHQNKDLLKLLEQIKDPQIQVFCNSFASIANLNNEQLSQIEEVLIAQCRDPFNQLGVQEFFKIQDLNQEVQQIFKQSLLQQNNNKKLLILFQVLKSCQEDKNEAFQILIDIINKYDAQDTYLTSNEVNQMNLLNSYLKYLEDHQYVSLIKKQNNICGTYNPLQLYDLDQQSVELVEYFKTFGENFILMKANTKERNLYERICGIGPHEVQLSKFILEQVLNQLLQQGEQQIVEAYCNQKLQGLQELEGPLKEINQSLNLALQQVLGVGNEEYQELIDKALIPGLVMTIKR